MSQLAEGPKLKNIVDFNRYGLFSERKEAKGGEGATETESRWLIKNLPLSRDSFFDPVDSSPGEPGRPPGAEAALPSLRVSRDN